MGKKLYIYLDESGDLGKSGSSYFTIAALSTENPKQIENLMKRVRKRKLKKSIKQLSKIKANNSDKNMREYILKKLVQSDCNFHIITITKEQVKSYLFEKKHKLYNYIAGLLIEDIDFPNKDIEVIIDKKDGNQLLKEDINKYIAHKIQEKKLLFNIKIEHLDSHCCRCLQAVDFIAWSTNRKFSFDDDNYYKIIEPKISSFKKLWK